MNITYVVLLMIALVLFIMMGKNPLEVPEGWVPPDEYKDGIKARIEQDEMGMGIGGPYAVEGQGTPLMQGFQTQRDGQMMGDYGSNSQNYRDFYGNNNNYGVAPPPSYEQVPLNQPPVRDDSVPEPFQNLPGAVQDNSPYNNNNNWTNPNWEGGNLRDLPAPGISPMRTTSGQPVKFAGSTVMTLNKAGHVVPMPDGVHYLADGSKITVRDGKNMFPVDGNEFY